MEIKYLIKKKVKILYFSLRKIVIIIFFYILEIKLILIETYLFLI